MAKLKSTELNAETKEEREERERLKAEASARIAFLQLQLRRLMERGEVEWRQHK